MSHLAITLLCLIKFSLFHDNLVQMKIRKDKTHFVSMTMKLRLKSLFKINMFVVLHSRDQISPCVVVMYSYCTYDDKYRIFFTGVNGDMVANEKLFHDTIPDLDESNALDPRTRNPQFFANTVSLNGPNVATEYARRPAMHVWH